AGNVQLFQLLTSYFDFAAAQPIGDSKLLEKIFEGRDTVTMGEAMAQGGELRKALQAIRLLMNDPSAAENAASYEKEGEKFAEALFGFGQGAYRSVSMALIPPADAAKKQWLTPADFMSVSQQGMGGILLDSEDPIDVEGRHLAALEKLALNRDNRVAFTQYAKEFRDLSIQRAKTRDEYAKIPIEVTFYRSKFFFYAQWLFVLGFVLTALSWLNLKGKAMPKVAGVAVFVPWALLVTGITYRCIIRNRPPISTLYETILFTTAVAVLVGMIMELINRQKIGLSIASFLGVLGVFIANKYEIVDGQDTMPELQAVLDTNFWLATHVTSVITGYAAGLLAAAVSNVYIFGRLFGLKKGDPTFYKTLLRMIYGIVCFGLLFSFVGTVLGGIWANYSWGRFWGWDPKENGALLIVLCNIAMLHSRMGGYIKEIGLAMASVFTGSVVAFSWWGVNLLGIGLHSYGFTTGIWGNLLAFWITQGVTLLAGAAVLIREHGRNTALAGQGPGTSAVAK
ncbi:MAG: cytochrome c biogenesis protein CcsA, partial [Candidatus Hydrogenedentota bacterium]